MTDDKTQIVKQVAICSYYWNEQFSEFLLNFKNNNIFKTFDRYLYEK